MKDNSSFEEEIVLEVCTPHTYRGFFISSTPRLLTIGSMTSAYVHKQRF